MSLGSLRTPCTWTAHAPHMHGTCMHGTPTCRYLATLEKHIEALHAAQVTAEWAPCGAAEPGQQRGQPRAAAQGRGAGQRRRAARAQPAEARSDELTGSARTERGKQSSPLGHWERRQRRVRPPCDPVLSWAHRYHGSPAAMIDCLPALLNNIKMMLTIARYYNTTERMTNLFRKITNQAPNLDPHPHPDD